MISSNKTKGFTLVELLIVIVVIAILAAISIVAYNGVTQKARDRERESNARNIVNAAAIHKSDRDFWPDINDLANYTVVKLPPNLTDSTKVGSSISAGRDTYKFQLCKNNGFTSNKKEATGVRVEYLREESPNSGIQNMTAGTCR